MSGSPSEGRVALAIRAAIALAGLFAVIGVVLFASAGTLAWPAGWAFMAVYGACALAITADLVVRDPALARRRMSGGPIAEPERGQKIIQALAGLFWFGLIVVSGLDRRFGWSRLPPWLEVVGDVLVILSFAGIWRVFMENSTAAATVRVEAGQKLIDTGPYGRVRHPMYLAALPGLIAIPLALGSAWGLVCYIPLKIVIWRRLLMEERLLERELPGYRDYEARVRWRLVPGLY